MFSDYIYCDREQIFRTLAALVVCPVDFLYRFHASIVFELHFVRLLYHSNDVITKIFDGQKRFGRSLS